jgi:hypothetical protein
MMESWIPGAELISAAVILVCFIIALMVILQVVGRSRTLGALGVVMVVASMIADAFNGSIGSVYGTTTVSYGVGSIIVAVLGAVGLVLLALAVVWARKASGPRGRR